MKDFLLFSCDGDGEYYEGAFATLAEAKAVVFDGWEGDSCKSYTVRKTSDDGFEVYGETSYHKDVPYLNWSDETIKDIGYQKEKRKAIHARRKREAKERAEAKAALYAKRDSGAELSISEKMMLSVYQTEEQMFANVFNNSFFEYGVYTSPVDVALVSSGHPYDVPAPSTGGRE